MSNTVRGGGADQSQKNVQSITKQRVKKWSPVLVPESDAIPTSLRDLIQLRIAYAITNSEMTDVTLGNWDAQHEVDELDPEDPASWPCSTPRPREGHLTEAR